MNSAAVTRPALTFRLADLCFEKSLEFGLPLLAAPILLLQDLLTAVLLKQPHVEPLLMLRRCQLLRSVGYVEECTTLLERASRGSAIGSADRIAVHQEVMQLKEVHVLPIAFF